MTLTETRPETVADDSVAAPAAPALGNWITTGDHKRLGLLFVYGGALSVIAGCIAAALFQLPSVGDAVTAWTQGGSRIASIAVTTALVIGVPALWIGLATYVAPLQIGATRLALPRLHNLALWLFFAGGVLVTVGYLADRSLLNGLGVADPAKLSGKANDATELLLAGLAIIAIATFLSALDLVVTLLTRRTVGLRMVHLPMFCWGVLGTASVLLLSTPAFLAGLVLLYYDRHYGGSLFSSAGGIKIWAHELWILGRPEALVYAAAGVGLFSDVIATHTRRPLVGYSMARYAAFAAPALTLLLWLGGSATITASPFAPIATVPAILLGLPVLLGLVTWLRSVRGGVRLHASVLFAVAYLLLIGLAAVVMVIGIIVKVDTPAEADAFRNGTIALLVLGLPLIAIAGGIVHWSPKLWGRVTSPALAGLQALALLGGAVLLAAPGYITGLGGTTNLSVLGTIGAVVVALGVVLVFANLVMRGADAPADPYEGLTLEWAAASPPAAFNFDALPEIRSTYPLYDARMAATSPGASA